MKILIDDFRDSLPDGTAPDLIARNYQTGENLIFMFGASYATSWKDHDLFIDHDLGGGEYETGYDLLCVIEETIFSDPNNKRNYLPKSITCVSDNPPGRKRIQLG